MNTFQIKMLACIFMLIDHMGVILFPNIIIFRIIGRLAFPIFAYLISVGYVYTNNVNKYMRRLLVFSLISQIPFMISLNKIAPNIFATLFLGLFLIDFHEKQENKKIGIIAAIFIALFSEVIRADGGAYGIMTIYLFYICRNDFKGLVRYQIILNCLFEFIMITAIILSGMQVKISLLLQPLALLALFIIKRYNNQKGLNIKYIFYFFYPIHLILLGFLNTLI